MVSCKPATLKEALELRARERVIPYAGGTDLMIEADPEASYLFLSDVPELKTLEIVDGNLEIGAAVTYTQALDSKLVPEILKEALVRYIAAPAIRNTGTLGGNVANGSPKADSALVFSVTDSILVLECADGARRVPIREFYLGRGKTCLKENELLTKIVMPLHNIRNYYYHKVGARGALAIARVSFAGLMRVEGGIICHAATAYGAVAGTILRRPDIDGMLIGRTVEEAKRISRRLSVRDGRGHPAHPRPHLGGVPEKGANEPDRRLPEQVRDHRLNRSQTNRSSDGARPICLLSHGRFWVDFSPAVRYTKTNGLIPMRFTLVEGQLIGRRYEWEIYM